MVENTNNLILPKKVTVDLVYLIGVLAGDGSINVRPKHDYEIKCVGNVKEKEFYDSVVCPIIKNLFDIEVKARLHDSETTYGIRIWSKELVGFLTELFELPIGKKYAKIKVPDNIKSCDKFYVAFIQGLADTDFSLTLKRRYRKQQYYPVIVGVSKNKKFMIDISKYLQGIGFSISEHFEKVQVDKRFGKTITHVIQMYGPNQLAKWMNTIGFRNTKHIKKFEIWKSIKTIVGQKVL